MPPLDSHYSVNTPEGISLYLSPAGPVARFLAWSIDLSIRFGIILVLFIVLSFAGNTGFGITLIFSFLLEWFYPVYFELRHAGQTPGKKALHLYVAHEDATPISASSSLVRNLLRIVDFLPLLYIFGLVSMLLNRRFQRLGDLVARTVVLHKPLQPSQISHNIESSIRPDIPLNLSEQQALIAYLQRSTQLSVARKQELAVLTGILVKDQKDPVHYLLSIANHLTGKKLL